MIDVEPPSYLLTERFPYYVPRPVDWTQPLSAYCTLEEIWLERLEDLGWTEEDSTIVARIWQGTDSVGNLYQAFIGKVQERPDWLRKN